MVESDVRPATLFWLQFCYSFNVHQWAATHHATLTNPPIGNEIKSIACLRVRVSQNLGIWRNTLSREWLWGPWILSHALWIRLDGSRIDREHIIGKSHGICCSACVFYGDQLTINSWRKIHISTLAWTLKLEYEISTARATFSQEIQSIRLHETAFWGRIDRWNGRQSISSPFHQHGGTKQWNWITKSFSCITLI
jgi:hypothetical protein